MPHYYPIFLNLESRTCLVVGAGSVGARKTAGILDAGARVRLVATQVGDAAAALLENANVDLIKEPYRSEHFDSVVLAFAATDNRSVNAQIVEDAIGRNIPVNCADSPEDDDKDKHRDGQFIVPATLRRGDLCLAISTGGASPKLAQRIRRELETVYSVEYGAYVELLAEMRSYIKERTEDPTLRSAAFDSLVEIEAEGKLRLLLRDTVGGQAGNGARREARRIVDAALLVPLE